MIDDDPRHDPEASRAKPGPRDAEEVGRASSPGYPANLPRSLGARRGLLACGVAFIVAATGAAPRDEPGRDDDLLRATVQLRNGSKRGSGTVIASGPGRTWILTAAHVVRDANALEVELHRFNFRGRITGLTEGGGWPRLVPAEVAAIDPAGDVALVSVRGMTALPFVARWDPGAAEPRPGEDLTSVGVDRGLHLTRWRTIIGNPVRIDLGKNGDARPFTVTTRPPEHGRSGGGLFRADGAVVGVCTGHFEAQPGRRVGAFASVASIRRLLEGRGIEIEGAGRTTRPPG